MRIGIIRDKMFTNELRGMNTAIALQKAGFEIFVLCYGEENKIEERENIILVRFHLNPKIRNKLHPLIESIPIYKYLWTNKIAAFIKKYHIQALQVHDLYMLGAAISANKKFKLPLIANLHENYPAAVRSYNWANSLTGKLLARPNLWEKLEGIYLKKMDKIIVLSEDFKINLIEKYPFMQANDLVVYPNVPNVSELHSYKIDPNILKKNNNFIIFYFGVNAERRGTFTCFEALKILKNQIPNVLLLLIGPVDNADRERFNKYINDPEIKDHVIYYSWKDIQFLPSYIYISDICLCPILKNHQHESGVANKVFQYMLFERPLIVSNCKPQQKIVEEKNCGLVHQSDNAQDLTEKIIQLYENPELRKQMGANGKKAVLEKYNLEKASNDIIEMYKELEKKRFSPPLEFA